MAKYNIWDLLVWVALAIVVLYLIGKVTGILKNPISVDVAAIVAGTYFIGRSFQKLETGCELSRDA